MSRLAATQHQNSLYGVGEYKRQVARLLASMEGMNDNQREHLIGRMLARYKTNGVPKGAERKAAVS